MSFTLPELTKRHVLAIEITKARDCLTRARDGIGQVRQGEGDLVYTLVQLSKAMHYAQKSVGLIEAIQGKAVATALAPTCQGCNRAMTGGGLNGPYPIQWECVYCGTVQNA